MRTVPQHRFTARDVVAGVSVALVAVPQSLAYAELAGLPGVRGLYAVGLPLVVAAFLASSPYLQTGPVATTALLTLGALLPLAEPRSADFVAMAALLALVVGGVRVAIGLTRTGWISYLMSRPVLEGFMSGAAVLIVLSQIPAALGLSPEGGVVGAAAQALLHPSAWCGTAAALSLGTVAVIALGRRLDRRIPGVLLAALGGLAWSRATGYAGPVVGAIPPGLPSPSLDLPWGALPSLILPGAVIALVGFAEAASISRTFASEDREHWDADREFVSQGAANLAAGLVGAFPVGGSFGRSAVNRLSGATSRWAGLVTGLAVVAFMPAAGVLAPLPKAVLAGIVMAAVAGLFRPRVLARLWRASRPQAVVAWSTFGLTLVLAPHVDHAILIGVLMAGAVHLWRELVVRVAAAREGDTLVLEPQGVLWFGSAPALDDEILRALSREPGVTRVVIRCGGLGRVDLTGAYQLAEILEQLGGAGLQVDVTHVPDHAREVLRAAGVEREG